MTVTTPELDIIARGMRAFCMAANKHPGGSLSAVEAVTGLFFSGVANLVAGEPERQRDHFVCSKGHAAAPSYFALWAGGFFPGVSLEQLLQFGQVGHRIPRMPRRDPRHGVEMSTGSLGQGLSFGIGLAIAARKQRSDRKVYVQLGDGECTEGQVWEAAMSAPRLNLTNIVGMLDANGSGSVIKLDRDSWSRRWTGFGWRVHDVDGHDLDAVTEALGEANSADRPTMLILHTIKGKGLLPTIEGSNRLSSEVSDEHIPDIDLEPAVNAGLALVDKHYPRAALCRAGTSEVVPAVETPAEPPSRRSVLDRLSSHEVGVSFVTKQVGGALVEELNELPILMMSPDAIRNSGLLPRMEKVGSWRDDNPESDVLEAWIAEQDSASMAAGAAAGGLLPVLFSMEGFYWRMLDQIRESIAFQELPVTLVGTSGGLGDLLGPMVQSDSLLTAIMSIRSLQVFEASDANVAKLLVAEALSSGRPTYLRLPHDAVVSRAPLADLRIMDLTSGYWTLESDPEPDLVVLTSGGLRDNVLRASDQLRTAYGIGVKVIEVFAHTRFGELPRDERSAIFAGAAWTASVHNAPSSVLGAHLPRGGLALGVDDWGLSGWPPSSLIEAHGLSVDGIFRTLSGLCAG